MEKTFHGKPVKIQIKPDITHLAVTKIQSAADNLDRALANLKLVW